ncbi:MAG: isochorismatase family cysteine hydrolase [Pseudolabrys sp.]|nr:isochorismatase family cysteine hydrolase [Pseudolabrys sp.]MDP2296935.1 isochorismatase family cysteine hydrolase [Pseudolabrys sp.]
MNQVIDLRAFTNPASLPTLVLIDMQAEYLATSRALALPNVNDALANCRNALEHARLMGMPVAYTRWLGSTFFNPATRSSGWIEGFEPHGSDSIFERRQPSCYASPHFAEVMTNNSGNFIMAGFAGEAACLSTAIDAFHRGHRVTYLADASASHGLADRPATEVHDFVGQLMGLWGTVMRTDSWIRTTSRIVGWKHAATLGDRP